MTNPRSPEARDAAFEEYEWAQHACGSFALPCCDYCADDMFDWQTEADFVSLTEEQDDD